MLLESSPKYISKGFHTSDRLLNQSGLMPHHEDRGAVGGEGVECCKHVYLSNRGTRLIVPSPENYRIWCLEMAYYGALWHVIVNLKGKYYQSINQSINQSELVGDVAVPVSVRQAVLF